MPTEREQLENAITALEAQRSVLGDEAVEAAIAGLRQKLAALDAQFVEQRKLVTVLFADVSSFTAISETMDPEDVIETMNSVWARLDVVIRAHGGAIDKHIGDSVMALWGADTAREDDPEQAILAALGMQEALREFKASLAEHLGPEGLHMRVAINTGLVHLGEVGTTHEFTAMGDTVNLASRLEKEAPVGGVLISSDTYRHVRGVFDVIECEPLAIRGKSEPVQAYIVERARPRAFRIPTRGIEGIETHMVGREAELALLKQYFEQGNQERKLHLMIITADAGIGKSRLVYEFIKWIDVRPETIRFFQGRSGPQTSSNPYGMIRDLFNNRFQIQDSDSLAVAKQKFIDGIADFMGEDSQDKAHFLGHLLGLEFSASPYLAGILSDAKQVRARAFHYAVQFFKAVTDRGNTPVLILLEDVHWADAESLEFIAHIASESSGLPLMILALARPSLFERHPGWGRDFPRMEIKPLTRAQSRALVGEILQRVESVPDVLYEVVIGGAEGNPYYMEELTKMLLDDGVIVKGAEHWHVNTEKLVSAKVPPTLTGVIQSRIDSLPPAEKLTLQRASVVGRVFWDGAVAHLADDEVALADEELDALASRELVFKRDASAFTGSEEFVFKHAILREVTYETVLKRLRRNYHKQVAEWLVAQSGERIREFTGLIADHFERAGETEVAVEYLSRAGEQAIQISAYREAIEYLERSVNLLGPESPQRAPILSRLGDALVRISEYTRAKACLEECIRLATASQDSLSHCQALYALGQLEYDEGRMQEAIALQEKALGLARDSGDKRWQARTAYMLGFNCVQVGSLDRGDAYLKEALKLAEEVGDRHTVAQCYSGMGVAGIVQGKNAEATDLFKQSLNVAREIGDRQRAAMVLSNMGWNYVTEGRAAEGVPLFQEAIQLSEELGDPFRTLITTINLGHAYAALEDIENARTAFRYAAHGAWKIKANGGLLEIVLGLAGLMQLEGDPERAAEWVGFALNHAAAREDTRQVAQPIEERLRKDLSSKAYAAAIKRGKKLKMETLIESIIGDQD